MEAGFFDVSMATIAKHSGLAKGTVYLYFKTKEEIFLALSIEELEDWLDEFDGKLQNLETSVSNKAFLEILRNTTEGRSVMHRLVSLLHMVLEKNIPYEEALAFKQYLIKRTAKTADLIEQALPCLNKGQGVEFLTSFHCLLIGWVQMTDPSPVLAKVLEHPDMTAFRFDLQTNLFQTLALLLDGMQVRSERDRVL